jgi:hypothetical protein
VIHHNNNREQQQLTENEKNDENTTPLIGGVVAGVFLLSSENAPGALRWVAGENPVRSVGHDVDGAAGVAGKLAGKPARWTTIRKTHMTPTRAKAQHANE